MRAQSKATAAGPCGDTAASRGETSRVATS